MFESISVGSGKTAVLVVGHFQGQGLDGPTRKFDPGRAIGNALKRGEATGDAGRVVEVFPKGRYKRVIVVGLGKKAKFTTEVLRNAVAAAGRRLAVTKDGSAQVELAGPIAEAKLDAAVAASAVGEAFGLLGWVCDQFKGKGGEPPKRTRLTLTASDEAFTEGMKRGLALAASANFARTLSETPPNIATPAWMAEQAKELGKKHGLQVKVFQGDAVEKERFEGLLNVGKASENKPCLIRLEWSPKGVNKNEPPLVLIGKTVTYDTGGLSLKVNNGMVGMKRDKDGGCAVLGAMHAIATVVKPQRRVVALLASAENSISDEAYRPDDVLRFRNGVTVEVTNTDAEGRLVLADALCWACEIENPAAIIDLATLTGGVVTALGSTYAGFWCDDDGLRRQVEAASATSGERIWRLPLHAEYRDMMKSPVADIVNSNPNRKAHPIQGAAFLSYFVREGVPWCHLDIAGVHAVEADYGPFIKGPTGWGTRLLAALVGATG
jgi:leucyl aminopeptidase